MEELDSCDDWISEDSDVDEEFRSCIEDEEWQDTQESLTEGCRECICDVSSEEDDDEVSSDDEEEDDDDDDDDDDDEFSLRMFFKGMSVTEDGGLGIRASGIGVVMEGCPGVPILKVQKKLDFFVEEVVAEHLALMDGLLEAQRNGVQRIVAYTNCKEVYRQIAETEPHEDQLLVALGLRILELADNLEAFVLKLVPRSDIEKPLRLAQEAIGILDGLVEECPICCKQKQHSQIINLCCSHSFCSDCLVMYVDGKLLALQVPVKCPELRCKYCISTNEFKSFLSCRHFESLERIYLEADVLNMGRIYCPFPDCSELLSPAQSSSSRASSSNQFDNNCIECPDCHRLVCGSCSVPWHSSMTCEEYQNLPPEDRDAGDITLQHLAQNNNWRHCQRCRRMIELTEGCYHMTCWCGHEFCYSCGAEYENGAQTCQCAFWEDEEDNSEPSPVVSNQETDQWRWESFNPLPSVTDGYSEQERAQLALIQRFLAGGFGLGDDHHYPCQSPPRCSDSYLDTIKDLHQLPWLERFVSVISDSYHEEYIQ